MRRKLKWGKTVLAIALAGAMSVTSVNVPSFSVFAAEQNEQEAQTRSMSYDGTTLTVRLQSNDLVLSPGDGKQVRDIQFFYAVYDSMEAARNDDVGDFFGKTDGAHTPTVGVDGSYSYSCERAISKGQVVRYNFNVLYNNADGTDAGACAQTFEYYTYANDSESAEPASETEIKKLEVYDNENGPKIEYKNNLFSFCLPKVNGEPIAQDKLDEVKNGYVIQVKTGDTWKNIEDSDSGITYNDDVANQENTWKYDYWTWDGGGAYVIMFNFKESKQIRFQSVGYDDVYVDYTLNYPITVTSLAFPTNEVDISSQGAYAIAFDSLIVNNGEDKVLGSSLQFSERLKWYIDPKADGNFVELGHEGSGLTWGANYGWDGAQPNGGFWFDPIKNTVVIKVELKDNPSVHAEIKLVIDDSVSEKGAEYDFKKDNSAYDYADPGKNKAGYDLVWSDEFDGNYGKDSVDANTGLNLDNWSYQLGDGTEVGNPGWGTVRSSPIPAIRKISQ